MIINSGSIKASTLEGALLETVTAIRDLEWNYLGEYRTSLTFDPTTKVLTIAGTYEAQLVNGTDGRPVIDIIEYLEDPAR